MRQTVLGMLVGVILVTVIVGYSEAWGQRPLAAEEHLSDAKSLVALSAVAEGRQQITLIDPKAKVVAVYHVDQATGTIALRSVRQVHWDFQLDDFNSTNPTPREIRAMAERR